MTPEWTISGEEGHTLDAAVRPASMVGLQGAVLTLQSLDVDTLTWSQVSGIVPDDKQLISLYWDGKREFYGTVSKRKYVYAAGGGGGYAITASGGLYRMSIAQITEDVPDGTGAAATRATFTFPPGDLRDSIIRLLGAAPGIIPGDIDPMFNIGRKSFTDGTWLSVLIDLLKPVADVAGWVDYASGGIPRLCIGRRPNMETLQIQIGVDAVKTIELTPRSELKVTGISLASAARDSTGKLVYAAQRAGDGSQIVSVSGPEIGPFIPPDGLPMVSIQTEALEVVNYWTLDPVIAQAISQYGALPMLGYWYGGLYGIPVSALNTGSGLHRITTGQVMDFLKTDYALVETQQRVCGWIGMLYDPGVGYGNAVGYLKTIGRALSYAATGVNVYSVFIDVTVPAINLSWPDLTDVYAKGAYEYLTPPSGMAEGMLAAANFVPYEGNIALNPGFPWQRFLSRRVNVIGGDPTLTTAGAIVQSAEITLASGAVGLRCGAPVRVSLNSAVSRYSGSSKDNIALV
ncbi:MAG: hypothetical protein WCP45_04770 [Verrucomicrobiota bacterium]